MTVSQYTAWIIFWIVLVGLVVFIICGCAGGGVAYYAPEPQSSSGNYDAVSAPSYVPQEVWVRRLGQPDELVTVMPAY